MKISGRRKQRIGAVEILMALMAIALPIICFGGFGCGGGPSDMDDPIPLFACNDGADNDGDTLIDMADPGCSATTDNNELGANQCDDGIDNDGDTLIDWPADPKCSSITDLSEFPFSSFKVHVWDIPGAPQTSVTPPPIGSVPEVFHPGITLEFHDTDTTLTAGTVTVGATTITLLMTVRNDTAETFNRTWLVVHTPESGVTLDPAPDGYLDEGVYYYLGTLAPGEQGQMTVLLGLPVGAIDEFWVFMDVASIHDRPVFTSNQPSQPMEIYSVKPDGADLIKLSSTGGTIFPGNPIWSRDGGKVAYSGGTGASDDQIYVARADGKGVNQLTCLSGYLLPGSYTPDGDGMYVRRYDVAVSADADIFLLDIPKISADCSDDTALTPLTDIYAGSETVPVGNPDGDLILYTRRNLLSMLPPYPFGTPNPTTCPDWPFGSELRVQSYDLYLLPVDPNTGLATGPEVFFWQNSLFSNGGHTFSSDGNSVSGYAGGCAEYQYYCSSTNQWAYKCNKSVTAGLYMLDMPTDLGDAALPYNYMVLPGSGKYHLLAGTNASATVLDYDPSSSIEYNTLLFSHWDSATGNIQLWYLDPLSPSTTRAQVTNFPIYNTTGRFMPAPGVP